MTNGLMAENTSAQFHNCDHNGVSRFTTFTVSTIFGYPANRFSETVVNAMRSMDAGWNIPDGMFSYFQLWFGGCGCAWPKGGYDERFSGAALGFKDGVVHNNIC
jgi:hypothetical protein